MDHIFNFRLLFTLLILTLIGSSCATNSTYSQRKKAKYNSSRSVVKTNRSRTQTKTRTYAKTTKQPSAARSAIVNTAKRHIGTRYVYGGKSPSGFDCSGFTAYVYQQNGIELTGASHNQARAGIKVSKESMQVGDLIFFGTGKVSHVGIVADIGPNSLKIIHSSSSKGVILEEISNSEYWQSRYLFGRDIITENYASR